MIPPPGFEDKKPQRAFAKASASSCRNCGQHGHIYKDCPHPITSFGIICFRVRKDLQDVEYLMIQRKDSLSFMEFIRGKYEMYQVPYISQLLGGMTQDERNMLTSVSFEQLWNHVWYQPSIPKHTSEFDHAREKFDALKEGYIHEGRRIILSDLLQQHPSPFKDPEWGFPKGRRKIREEDVNCAIREFCEETNFNPVEIRIVEDIPPFEEIFFGTNHVLYRHIYYAAKMVGDASRSLQVDPRNVNQAREVRALRWFNAREVVEHIRDHNQERKQLFEQAHRSIVQNAFRRNG